MLLVKLFGKASDLDRMNMEGTGVVLGFIARLVGCAVKSDACTLTAFGPVRRSLPGNERVKDASLSVGDLMSGALADGEAGANLWSPGSEDLLLMDPSSLTLVERAGYRHAVVYDEALDLGVESIIVISEHVEDQRPCSAAQNVR